MVGEIQELRERLVGMNCEQDPRIILLDLEVSMQTGTSAVDGVIFNFGEVSDGGKGQSQEVFMCFGSVRMEKFAQIYKGKAGAERGSVSELKELFMNGRERLMGAGQKHIGINGVLGLFRDP